MQINTALISVLLYLEWLSRNKDQKQASKDVGKEGPSFSVGDSPNRCSVEDSQAASNRTTLRPILLLLGVHLEDWILV